MSKPCVSFIVPIYNVEKYLHRCVDSLTNQTLKNIEIILIDDESPDSCPLICDMAAKKDSRIRVIHKKNQGLGFARNSGLEVATGEYVYFVDSDDYVDVRAADILYVNAKKDNLDICFAGIYSEDEKGNITPNIPKYAGRLFKQPEITSIVLKDMLGSDPVAKIDASVRMSAWQGIYRRAWIEENNLRFPSEREFISEDIIFHLDALPYANKMCYLEECLYFHTIDNPTSLTHKYNSERFNKCSILYLEEKRKIESIYHNKGMVERAQRMYLGNVRVCLKQIVQKSRVEGMSFAFKEIKKIVEDDRIQNVLSMYPYRKNPIKQAIMSYLIRTKKIFLIYCMTFAAILK